MSRTVVLPNGESVVATHAWWGTDGSVEVNVNAIYLETRTGSRKILYEEGSTRNDWPGQTFHSLADRLRGQIHKGGEPLVLLEWLQQQKKLSPRIKLVE